MYYSAVYIGRIHSTIIRVLGSKLLTCSHANHVTISSVTVYYQKRDNTINKNVECSQFYSPFNELLAKLPAGTVYCISWLSILFMCPFFVIV